MLAGLTLRSGEAHVGQVSKAIEVETCIRGIIFIKNTPCCYRFWTNKGGFLLNGLSGTHPEVKKRMIYKNTPSCYRFWTNKGDIIKGGNNTPDDCVLSKNPRIHGSSSHDQERRIPGSRHC